MNDPHVAALVYKIEHGPSVDYSEAEPLDREETDFHVQIANEEVRFEFKEHYATEDAARKAIEEYIRAWEFDAGLQRGPNYFQLKFNHAQIKDRNPTLGVGDVSVHIRSGVPTVTVGVSVLSRCYPPPPSGVLITADVQTLYDRYMGYCQDREPLAAMAYFCLTVLEESAAQQPQKASTNRKPAAKRKSAAEKYGIELEVLTKIGFLASEKGGHQGARKASGKDNDLTAQETRFLKEAIKEVIHRAAELAHTSDGDLPKISLSAFPPV